MKTLQDQYKLIKEGKGHKGVFLKEAKQMFPNYIRNAATFEEASNILKDKNVISENLVGLEPINTISRKKESYETAFENFLEEARKKNDNDPNAEIKKVSQQVEDKLKHNFDRTDKKNPDNQIFGEIMKGYYCEMKDPKNANKTEEQLRDIVLKNLAKDPIYYTKNGMFGEKGVGVEMDVPGLGEPKELKGKYKSSGYGDLKEGKIKRNYPNFLDSEYQGETIPMTGDELYTFLVDTMAISRNVDDFIQKVTYGLTDETSTLSSENEEKLRNWWDKNYNMNESIDESKVRKLINTMIKQELISENKKYQKTIMEIEKASKLAELTTKMEALDKAIEEKNSRLNSIDESEEMKELVDRNAMRELQKEVKLLEKYKDKVLKIYEKLTKTKKKEVIDEDEPLNEELPADSKETVDNMNAAKDAAGEFADELERADKALEEDETHDEGENELPQEIINQIIPMYVEEGMEIEDIASMYPKMYNEVVKFFEGYDLGNDYDI